MTSRLALALVLLAASPALAQPAPKAAPAPVADDMAAFEKDLDALFVHGGLTAEAAAARAGKVSPAAHRKAAELEAATAVAVQTELLQVPTVRASASANRLADVSAAFTFGTMVVPFKLLTHFYDSQATVSVPLSDYVFRFPNLVKSTHLAEDAARTGRLASVVDAGQDARVAYYEWVRARLQVLIAQRQLAQVQATLGQEKALLEVQRVAKADYLRIQSQAADAEQTLDQLKNLAALREEQLRLLIGALDDEPLAVGEDIRQDLVAPPTASFEDLVHHALGRRLDVLQLDQGIAAKDLQRKAEKANGYPKLAAVGFAEYANPNPRVISQADKFTLTWQIGVQLSWQLGDTLIAETNARRLIAETDELRADRENLDRATRIAVLSAMQSVQLAVNALQTTQKGLAAAEEGYRVRKELLAAERATAVELVDAETELTRARVAALNARVDLRVAISDLTHAIGDDAPTAR